MEACSQCAMQKKLHKMFVCKADEKPLTLDNLSQHQLCQECIDEHPWNCGSHIRLLVCKIKLLRPYFDDWITKTKCELDEIASLLPDFTSAFSSEKNPSKVNESIECFVAESQQISQRLNDLRRLLPTQQCPRENTYSVTCLKKLNLRNDALSSSIRAMIEPQYLLCSSMGPSSDGSSQSLSESVSSISILENIYTQRQNIDYDYFSSAYRTEKARKHRWHFYTQGDDISFDITNKSSTPMLIKFEAWTTGILLKYRGCDVFEEQNLQRRAFELNCECTEHVVLKMTDRTIQRMQETQSPANVRIHGIGRLEADNRYNFVVRTIRCGWNKKNWEAAEF